MVIVVVIIFRAILLGHKPINDEHFLFHQPKCFLKFLIPLIPNGFKINNTQFGRNFGAQNRIFEKKTIIKFVNKAGNKFNLNFKFFNNQNERSYICFCRNCMLDKYIDKGRFTGLCLWTKAPDTFFF